MNLIGTSDFDKRLKSYQRCKDQLNAAFSKLKRFWDLNGRSTVVNEVVHQVCGRHFPRPSVTRWNSFFDAIDIAEKNKISINQSIDEINREAKRNINKFRNILRVEKLSVPEWRLLKEYSDCMRPIAMALDILQGDKHTCQRYILPVLFGIKYGLEEISDSGKMSHILIFFWFDFLSHYIMFFKDFAFKNQIQRYIFNVFIRFSRFFI